MRSIYFHFKKAHISEEKIALARVLWSNPLKWYWREGVGCLRAWLPETLSSRPCVQGLPIPKLILRISGEAWGPRLNPQINTIPG